jgi:hypothetical protein
MMTREEKLEQLERILQGHTLHGSENLKNFLRFVVQKTVDSEDSQLKEYVIATEVFGRSSDYNTRIDSVVRVQAGRLRSKLQEYYATEGKDDKVVIDLPKGHYTPIFSYAPENGGHHALTTDTNGISSDAVPDTSPKKIGKRRYWLYAISGVALCSVVVLGTLLYGSLLEVRRLKSQVASNVGDATERRHVEPVWGPLLSSPEPVLVVFSNALFEGDPQQGMKRYQPQSTKTSSPALNQNDKPREDEGLVLNEHYTGIGEVMGVYFLGDFMGRIGHVFRVKRSLLLTWDDVKSQNIVVLGSPAENEFLRDLPEQQEIVFRWLKGDKGEPEFGVVLTNPRAGEESQYLPTQEGRSRNKITGDYAVVSRLRGLDPSKRLFILAGVTTLATQAAVEYVTRPEYVNDLITHLNTTSDKSTPQLPACFQILLRVKVNGGVPVQVSYVTHRVIP